MNIKSLTLIIVGFVFAGCTGQFAPLEELSIIPDQNTGGGGGGHGGGGGNGGGQQPTAACVPGEVAISQKKIRRLTSTQISNIVNRVYTNDSRFRNLDYAAFSDPIADKGFTGESEKTVTDKTSLERWINSVEKLAANVFSGKAPIPTACRADFTKNTCIEDELNKYARKLLRRPPTTQELAEVRSGIEKIKTQGASLDLQIAFLHKYLLYNTSFFHRTEMGVNNNNLNTVVDLDDYEIASFLSYSIINDAPDDALFAKAEQGLLKTQSVVVAEAERLLALPQAKENLRALLMDFLKLNKISTVASDKFRKYTYDGNFAIPLAVRNTLAKTWHDQSFRVKHEVLDSDVKNFIDLRLGNNLNYMNIFSGNVFPVTNRTIAIYGVRDKASLDTLFADSNPDPGNMHYTFTTNYTANSNERHGIFSHPAFLSVHSKENDTGLVHRGVFFLEQILCNEMPAAPANVFPREDLPPGYDPTVLTSRKKFEILHSQQSACFFCHKSIDNIGGSFESFDQTGFFQKTETFQYENKWYTLPIDSSGQLTGVGNVNISYDNTIDFIKKVQQTPEFKRCVNTRLLEFINGERSNSVNSCGYTVKADNILRSPSSTFRDLILTNIQDINFFKRRTEGGE